MNDIPYFGIPCDIIDNGAYSNYSLDSKMLFGIMLNYAKSAEELIEAANLAKKLGKGYIDKKLELLKEGNLNGKV